MIEAFREDRRFNSDTRNAEAKQNDSRDTMDDEEKLLANRTDVNMPALLTKDVLGG